MRRRIIVALLSIVLSSLILAYLYNTGMSLFLLMTGFAYLLGGVPISFFIDKHVEKEKLKVVFYLIAGFIVGAITIIIFSLLLDGGKINFNVLTFGIYGSVGSFIFFIFMLLITKRKKYETK